VPGTRAAERFRSTDFRPDARSAADVLVLIDVARQSPVQPDTKFATTWWMRRDGRDGRRVPDDDSGEGHVVELGRRLRRARSANASDANRWQSAAIALLTPDERAALNLTASDDPLPRSGSTLIAAASGLAKLAAAHVARCLTADTDMRELTRKDRLALAFAPRLSADVRQAVPMDESAPRGSDPIVALLEGSQDNDPDNLIVHARLERGPRRVDQTDERSRSD